MPTLSQLQLDLIFMQPVFTFIACNASHLVSVGHDLDCINTLSRAGDTHC